MENIFVSTILDALREFLMVALIISAIYLSFDLFKAPQIRRDGKLLLDGRILDKKDIPHYKVGALFLIAIIPAFWGLYKWIFTPEMEYSPMLFIASLNMALIGAKNFMVFLVLKEHYGI